MQRGVAPKSLNTAFGCAYPLAMSNLGNLTTAEIADAHGVSYRTVLNWVRTGRVTPVTKLPGRTGTYLFGPDALPKHLREETASA